jgi:hypothetical protein
VTNQLDRAKVLERAIEIAVDNGLRAPDWVQGPQHWVRSLFDQVKVYQLIYDKQFARALWGEQKSDVWNDYDIPKPGTGWQHHLQQMVIADDPIAYLADNLPPSSKGSDGDKS